MLVANNIRITRQIQSFEERSESMKHETIVHEARTQEQKGKSDVDQS